MNNPNPQEGLRGDRSKEEIHVLMNQVWAKENRPDSLGFALNAGKSLGDWLIENAIPEPNTGCWLWTRYFNNSGYGIFSFKHKTFSAHRVSYECFRGKIPEGMCVCHKCDTPTCINPDHLWLGDIKDNTLDMCRKGRYINFNKHKTHCKRGHEFTPENTRRSKGGRHCIKCAKMRHLKTEPLAELRAAISTKDKS